jgi:hypothetical protein
MPKTLKDELYDALKALAFGMDRAGGDAHGMPECPWCKAGPDGDDHRGDCELAQAREVLAKVDALLQSSEGPCCDCGAALTMCADCVIGDYQAAHPECTACCPVQPAEGRETPDLQEAREKLETQIQIMCDEIRAWGTVAEAKVTQAIDALITAALAHGRKPPE